MHTVCLWIIFNFLTRLVCLCYVFMAKTYRQGRLIPMWLEIESQFFVIFWQYESRSRNENIYLVQILKISCFFKYCINTETVGTTENFSLFLTFHSFYVSYTTHCDKCIRCKGQIAFERSKGKRKICKKRKKSRQKGRRGRDIVEINLA